MNKSELELVANLLDVAAGTAEERNLSNSFAHGAKQLRDAIAQLEKAPEPEWVHLEFTGKETIATSLYTSPPEVAELVKQNVELLHRITNLQSLYASANKATEQAHVSLAESQHKVTDLEKQVQALRAENKLFRTAIDADPTFGNMKPDLDLIEQALNMEDGTLRFGSVEYARVQDAIAALKRIKGDV